LLVDMVDSNSLRNLLKENFMNGVMLTYAADLSHEGPMKVSQSNLNDLGLMGFAKFRDRLVLWSRTDLDKYKIVYLEGTEAISNEFVKYISSCYLHQILLAKFRFELQLSDESKIDDLFNKLEELP